MSFIEFFFEYSLKNEATSNTKLQKIHSSSSLKDVGIFLRDGLFKIDMGIVKFYLFQGSHWVLHVHECYNDSYGNIPPSKQSNFIKKRNGHCLYSELKTQHLTNRKDSHSAGFFKYIFYLTKILGIDFASAVSNIYYQMIQ